MVIETADNRIYQKNESFAFARLLFFKNSVLTEIEKMFEELIWQ